MISDIDHGDVTTPASKMTKTTVTIGYKVEEVFPGFRIFFHCMSMCQFHALMLHRLKSISD